MYQDTKTAAIVGSITAVLDLYCFLMHARLSAPFFIAAIHKIECFARRIGGV